MAVMEPQPGGLAVDERRVAVVLASLCEPEYRLSCPLFSTPHPLAEHSVYGQNYIEPVPFVFKIPIL